MKRTELPTFEDVCEALEMPDMVGAARGSIEHTIGLLLIFSCFVGENAEQLHIQTNVPAPVIEAISAILKKNGVFDTGIDRFNEYFKDEQSGIILNCDIMCGQDLLRRALKNGKPAFQITDLGVEFAENLMATHPGAMEFLDKVIGDKKLATEAYLRNKAKQKRKSR